MHGLFDVSWCATPRAAGGVAPARLQPLHRRRLTVSYAGRMRHVTQGPACLNQRPAMCAAGCRWCAGEPHLLHAPQLLPAPAPQRAAHGAQPPHRWVQHRLFACAAVSGGMPACLRCACGCSAALPAGRGCELGLIPVPLVPVADAGCFTLLIQDPEVHGLQFHKHGGCACCPHRVPVWQPRCPADGGMPLSS